MKTNIFKTIRLTLFAGLLVLVAASCLSAQDFVIEQYGAVIRVNQNSTVDITESIQVNFERQKHGIYREIPYRYVDELGHTKIMPISVHSVKDADGNPHTYRVSHQGNVVNIRIGDADRYVHGQQTYVIDYTVENALLFFDNHDELYWNVTGNYWQAPIKKASALVTLNADKKSSGLSGDCYTGHYGSNQSNCSTTDVKDGVLFETTEPLGSGEGLTIAFGWDKGIVTPPSDWQKFVWRINLVENWVFVLPPLVFIFMIVQWFRKGRDPKVREAVTVMYDPPKAGDKPLSAAEVGTLIDEQLDQRDLSAAIVGLAVKGFIKIKESENEGLLKIFTSKEYELIKLKDRDFDLTPFERQLFDDLFEDGATSVLVSDLKNKFYVHISSLKSTLFKDLLDKKFFGVSPDKVKGKYSVMGFVLMFAISLILFLIMPSGEWKGFIVGVISGLIVILFANAMPAKTRLGALARMHILGFREFMNRADRDRLERMGQDVYYKYLPYAIALDVVDHWTKAFQGLLTDPPNWYVASHGFATFTPILFANSITAASSHLGNTIFSAPRGSGSSGGGGGGGFSGGGGGGGGGGSW